MDMNPNHSTCTVTVTDSSKNFQLRNFSIEVEDVFDGCVAEKLKVLNSSQDKNHSAYSLTEDKAVLFLNNSKRTPILWPNMSDTDSWDKLDSAVSSSMDPSLSITDRMTGADAGFF